MRRVKSVKFNVSGETRERLRENILRAHVVARHDARRRPRVVGTCAVSTRVVEGDAKQSFIYPTEKSSKTKVNANVSSLLFFFSSRCFRLVSPIGVSETTRPTSGRVRRRNIVCCHRVGGARGENIIVVDGRTSQTPSSPSSRLGDSVDSTSSSVRPSYFYTAGT